MNANQNKQKRVIAGIFFFLVIIAGILIYYTQFYEEDLNKALPLSYTSKVDNQDQESAANQLLVEYLQSFQATTTSAWKRIIHVDYQQFQLLAGDENQFAVGATFDVKLEKGKWSAHHKWGKVQKDGTIKGIRWTLRIKKTGEHTFTLERIETTSQAVAGLDPVKDIYQKKAGIKLPDKNNRYQLINEELQVTYDNGEHWQTVPALIDDVFAGGYPGSRQELMEGSYVISPERTAFVIGNNDQVRILLSEDKGKKWKEVPVPSTLPGIRMRLLGFTSEQDGYLILTGDKTMSWEANMIFKTHDGGLSWIAAGHVEEQRLITDGAFITDQLGFISFGSINVMDQLPRPSLYRTTDGGKNWAEVDVPIPAEYKGIFIEAEVPTFDGSQGTLLVNQGPSGDYQGGKVKAKYISLDQGATWTFANLVDPDNVMGK
ncbi:WD40/YVTN/BNR-like repeat-containing protein [Neobacillus jeddahensis]|uniref:WD40/YVTN/BNR-like repeat-containing protein n=1 Tax=Neobacillus jeddahensis TaxID=1461580 RepID=UPI000694805D|nr:sialidase family protein [Neobacillus jeddahensis]